MNTSTGPKELKHLVGGERNDLRNTAPNTRTNTNVFEQQTRGMARERKYLSKLLTSVHHSHDYNHLNEYEQYNC